MFDIRVVPSRMAAGTLRWMRTSSVRRKVRLALRGRVVLVPLAQLHLQGLAGSGVWDLVHELDGVRQRPLRMTFGQEGGELFLRHLLVLLEDHHPYRPLTPPLVRDGDDGGFGDGVVGHQGVLESHRGDPLPPALYEVLGPVLDLHVPTRIYGDDIAGLEPAVLGELLGVLGVVISPRDPRTPDLQLPHALPVPRSEALVAPRPYLDERPRQALLGPDPVPLVLGSAVHEAAHVADGAKRGRLGHAPGVEYVQPVAFLEGPDHTLRRRRPADDHGPQIGQIICARVLVELVQDAEEDGGHPGGDGDLLVREVL